MARIIEWFDRASKYYAKKHEREIAKLALYRMTDRELRDIGMTRADIERCV
jgi:uncharacterized protein YjiS (DUF1127 family)